MSRYINVLILTKDKAEADAINALDERKYGAMEYAPVYAIPFGNWHSAHGRRHKTLVIACDVRDLPLEERYIAEYMTYVASCRREG